MKEIPAGYQRGADTAGGGIGSSSCDKVYHYRPGKDDDWEVYGVFDEGEGIGPEEDWVANISTETIATKLIDALSGDTTWILSFPPPSPGEVGEYSHDKVYHYRPGKDDDWEVYGVFDEGEGIGPEEDWVANASTETVAHVLISILNGKLKELCRENSSTTNPVIGGGVEAVSRLRYPCTRSAGY